MKSSALRPKGEPDLAGPVFVFAEEAEVAEKEKPGPARSGSPRKKVGPILKIKVNGDERDITDGTTVRALVAQFNFVPEKVAIELNRRLVRADKYDTPLKSGDEIEIVTFVGGG